MSSSSLKRPVGRPPKTPRKEEISKDVDHKVKNVDDVRCRKGIVQFKVNWEKNDLVTWEPVDSFAPSGLRHWSIKAFLTDAENKAKYKAAMKKYKLIVKGIKPNDSDSEVDNQPSTSTTSNPIIMTKTTPIKSIQEASPQKRMSPRKLANQQMKPVEPLVPESPVEPERMLTRSPKKQVLTHVPVKHVVEKQPDDNSQMSDAGSLSPKKRVQLYPSTSEEPVSVNQLTDEPMSGPAPIECEPKSPEEEPKSLKTPEVKPVKKVVLLKSRIAQKKPIKRCMARRDKNNKTTFRSSLLSKKDRAWMNSSWEEITEDDDMEEAEEVPEKVFKTEVEESKENTPEEELVE